MMFIPTCTYHGTCLRIDFAQLEKWTYVETIDCCLETLFHLFDGALVTALLQEPRNDPSPTEIFSFLNNVGQLSVEKCVKCLGFKSDCR